MSNQLKLKITAFFPLLTRRLFKFSMAPLINKNISQRHLWKKRRRKRHRRMRLPLQVSLRFKKMKSLLRSRFSSKLILKLNLRQIKLTMMTASKMMMNKMVSNQYLLIDNKPQILKSTLKLRKISVRIRGTDGDL